MDFSIDTNIIISVYFSGMTNDNKDNIRRKYYKKWTLASKIFVSKVAILELYNFILRDEYRKYQKVAATKIKLAKFTKIPEFKKIKKGIIIKISSLFGDDKIMIVGSTREKLMCLISGELEPNDQLILDDSRRNGVCLLTEDADFSDIEKDVILIDNNIEA